MSLMNLEKCKEIIDDQLSINSVDSIEKSNVNKAVKDIANILKGSLTRENNRLIGDMEKLYSNTLILLEKITPLFSERDITAYSEKEIDEAFKKYLDESKAMNQKDFAINLVKNSKALLKVRLKENEEVVQERINKLTVSELLKSFSENKNRNRNPSQTVTDFLDKDIESGLKTLRDSLLLKSHQEQWNNYIDGNGALPSKEIST